jgi:hypothetical protein
MGDKNTSIRYKDDSCIVNETNDYQLAEALLIKHLKREMLCVCGS